MCSHDELDTAAGNQAGIHQARCWSDGATTGVIITYRGAVGPQQGRKVFILQTLPASEEVRDSGAEKVAEFSLQAGVAARAGERQKLERLCRYISRPVDAENACHSP